MDGDSTDNVEENGGGFDEEPDTSDKRSTTKNEDEEPSEKLVSCHDSDTDDKDTEEKTDENVLDEEGHDSTPTMVETNVGGDLNHDENIEDQKAYKSNELGEEIDEQEEHTNHDPVKDHIENPTVLIENHSNEEQCNTESGSVKEEPIQATGEQDLEMDCGMLRPIRPPKPPPEFSDEDDEKVIGISPLQAARLSGTERNKLYKRGQKFEKKGKQELALKCYLRCIMGVTDQDEFPFVIDCLRGIANIYREKGEERKAEQFEEAEKMYKKPTPAPEAEDEIGRSYDSVYGASKHGLEEVDSAAQMKTAEEYEVLAQVFLHKSKDSKLALQYAAKSVKLKQKILGMNHPKTQEGLDFFSQIYAEIGKRGLVQSLTGNEFDDSDLETDWDFLSETSIEPDVPAMEKPERKGDKQKKEVKFGETSYIDDEAPNWVPVLVARVILFMAFIVFCIFALVVYCQNDMETPMCVAVSDQSVYFTRKVKALFD